MIELDVKNPFDQSYHDMLARILREGVRMSDRTGTGTLAIFGHFQSFDLSQGFPLITTKKIHLKSIIHELLWMLSGSTNIKYLKDNGVSIWDEWADENGELGPVYGSQWRSWEGKPTLQQTGEIVGNHMVTDMVPKKIDQVVDILRMLRSTKPWSRRIMLSAWNVAEVPNMHLPPCHFNAQFRVEPKDPVIGYDAHVATPHSTPIPGKLHCQMSIRSWDTFLGGPFNIAQYALLTMMLAYVSGLEPGVLTIASGDTHLYLNHLEQARLQLSRTPNPPPRMIIEPGAGVTNIDDFRYEHFRLERYDPHPHIKGDVSV